MKRENVEGKALGDPSPVTIPMPASLLLENATVMIENIEFQCVGEHRRGKGMREGKPFPSISDPLICMLDRSVSDPSILGKASKDRDLDSISMLRQVQIEISTQFQCMLGRPCLLYCAYLTVRICKY